MNPKDIKSKIKKYERYEIETKDNTLWVVFLVKKITRIFQKILIFSVIIQTILSYLMIYIYREDVVDIAWLMIFLLFFLTFLSIWGVWSIRWKFLAEKKMELNSIGVICYRELSGKIKKEYYPWEEIQEFISTQYKGYKFLTIKKIDGKEKQLALGMSEIDVQRLIFKLNGFKKSLFARSHPSSAMPMK